MAGSRESWLLLITYIDHEYPPAISGHTPETAAADHVPIPEGRRVRHRHRDLFRRFPGMIAGPGRIRAAD
jgi:hypothetical protein